MSNLYFLVCKTHFCPEHIMQNSPHFNGGEVKQDDAWNNWDSADVKWPFSEFFLLIGEVFILLWLIDASVIQRIVLSNVKQSVLVISVMYDIFHCLKHIWYAHQLEISCFSVFRQLVLLTLTNFFYLVSMVIFGIEPEIFWMLGQCTVSVM
jgi:hypothetical protein